MAKYIKREIWVEETEIELPAAEVMTIAQAARYLGVYTQAVSLALDRGDMTLLIDRDAPQRQGRRLVLRSEVEVWKQKREQRQVEEEVVQVQYTW